MAIVIPAIVDAQLLTLKNSILPHSDSTMHTEGAGKLYPDGNRVADLLRNLTGLVDATGLTVQGIHGLADAADQTAVVDATNQGTGEALANDLKAKYELHRVKVAGNVHWAADAANAIAVVDATDEASLVALANDLKAKFNAHAIKVSANTHRFADAKAVTAVADATDTATACTLVNAIKALYNAHCVDIGCSLLALSDTSAFTTNNSLIGAKVTFTGNVTAALAGATAYVLSNTVTLLNFAPGALAAIPKTGDTYAVEYTVIDKEITVLDGGKGTGAAQVNPYANGPSFINAAMIILARLGASVPSYLTAAAAQPFGIGSPYAGGGSRGSGGGMLMADALQAIRNAVAAYTKPA